MVHPMVSPNGFHLICIGERSEAVNCEQSEQEGEAIYIWFPSYGSIKWRFCIGEQKRWLL